MLTLFLALVVPALLATAAFGITAAALLALTAALLVLLTLSAATTLLVLLLTLAIVLVLVLILVGHDWFLFISFTQTARRRLQDLNASRAAWFQRWNNTAGMVIATDGLFMERGL